VGPYHNPHVTSAYNFFIIFPHFYFDLIENAQITSSNENNRFRSKLIQEKYEYYSLPFCQPKKRIETRFEGLGEALEGYELIKSDIQIKFKRKNFASITR
jgi:hypothetical protein